MKLENNWKDKSLEALENRSYGNPTTAQTCLIKHCFEYVKLPIGSLNTEQLRMLIGQQIGLIYLVPLALDTLDKDILAEGDFYPGDLLKSVTTIDAAFWRSNPELYVRSKSVIIKGRQRIRQYQLDI